MAYETNIPGLAAELETNQIPELTLATFEDRLTVEVRTASSDGIGGTEYSYSNLVTGVPCQIRRHRQGRKQVEGDEINSHAHYIVTMPRYFGGSRIDLDAQTHRLKIEARTPEPEKTFKIISVSDEQGVHIEAECDEV